jgi:hypothetical protein
MAGLGSKLFTDGSVLNAAQVNGYLMDQSIMRFATTAARDAAFGGVGEATLSEGMTCYIDNLNIVQVYDGSNWVTIANATYPYQNPSGLELVTSCTATFTGGTAGSVSNGVVTIGTGNQQFEISNAFSATYDAYRIIYTGGTVSSSTALLFNYIGITTGYYGASIFASFGGGSASVGGVNNASTFQAGRGNTGTHSYCFIDVEVFNPFLSRSTLHKGMDMSGDVNFGSFTGRTLSTASTTGFRIQTSGVETMTGGNLRVYGYRN